MTQEMETQTVNIGDKQYRVEDLNERGKQIVRHLQVITNRVNEHLAELERLEVQQNTFRKMLYNHVTEAGYEPIADSESDSDGEEQEQSEQ